MRLKRTLYLVSFLVLVVCVLVWCLTNSEAIVNEIEITVRDGRTQENIIAGIEEPWTLEDIARSIGMDISSLMKMNGILDPESIYPGQILKTQPYSLSNKAWVSWYEDGPNETMSNGEIFDAQDETICAHRWLPFGTRVRLTDLATGESIEVVIRDRGPYVDMEKRHFDLSRSAAEKLGIINIGVAECYVEIIGLGE